jgi:vancomycin aglycone glucosyltransferase
MLRKVLNEQRSALGLPPIKNVFRYLITEQPWLAADPTLSPAGSAEVSATQTGAWLLRDPAPLSERVEQFLAAGEPPIYFGFGSMPGSTPEHTARLMIAAARALQRRAIISRGWSGLSTSEVASDVIAIDAEPHDALFARVAAVVHHGGAGTTATAARAGKPQVVIPHLWDQFYWAYRVQQLRLGESVSGPARLSADKLITAIGKCLTPEIGAHARALATHIEPNGTRSAAELLIQRFGRDQAGAVRSRLIA